MVERSRSRRLGLVIAVGVVFLMAAKELRAQSQLHRSDIIIAGSEAQTFYHPTIIRADKDGMVLWDKPLPLISWQDGDRRWADRDLLEDAFYVGTNGYTTDDRIDGVVHRVLKLDRNGDLQWDTPISPSSYILLSANPVCGGVYVLGANDGLYKVSKDGEILWGPLNYSFVDRLRAVSTDTWTGGAYIAADTSLLKLDGDGGIVWITEFPEVTGAVDANPVDGGVYVGAGFCNRLTYRLDKDGNVLWQKTDFPSPYTYGRAVSPANGTLFVGSGWSHSLAGVKLDGTVQFWVSTWLSGYNSNVAAAIDGTSIYVGEWAEKGIYKRDSSTGAVVWNQTYGPSSWVGRYSAVSVYTGAPYVPIDIKPRSFPNSINLGSGGSVPVAILSTPAFDATTVDTSSLTLAGAQVRLRGKGTPMAAWEDINGDDLMDVVVHVATSALELTDTDAEAVLVGQTFSGDYIRGVDTVRIVP